MSSLSLSSRGDVGDSPHVFEPRVFTHPVWCKFCTLMISVFTKGYICKGCKFVCHKRCLEDVPNMCMQPFTASYGLPNKGEQVQSEIVRTPSKSRLRKPSFRRTSSKQKLDNSAGSSSSFMSSSSLGSSANVDSEHQRREYPTTVKPYEPSRYEQIQSRLRSFAKRGWTLQSPTPESLAQGGFYFTPAPDKPDKATCWRCRRSLWNWKPGDEVVKMHRKISIACPVAQGDDPHLDCAVSNQPARKPAVLSVEPMTERSNLLRTVHNELLDLQKPLNHVAVSPKALSLLGSPGDVQESLASGGSRVPLKGNRSKSKQNLMALAGRNRKGGSNEFDASEGVSTPYNVQHQTHVDENFEWSGKEEAETAFNFTDELGRGAYGAVMRAVHRASGFSLAVKFIPTNDDGARETLQKEVDVLKACNSTNVLSYYGTVTTPDQIWILMDYCGGGSIKDIMKATLETLEEDQISEILVGTLRGLSYLHGRATAIYHMDIKSANILLTYDQGKPPVVKIADFGVSEQLQNASSGFSVKLNDFVGSPLFMAPEVIAKTEFNDRADVWSLGICVIEMAEGRPPNTDIKNMEMLPQLLNRAPPTLHTPKLWSASINDFLRKCLVKDPAKRSSASEMLQHPFVQDAIVREAEDKMKAAASGKRPPTPIEPLVKSAVEIRARKLARERADREAAEREARLKKLASAYQTGAEQPSDTQPMRDDSTGSSPAPQLRTRQTPMSYRQLNAATTLGISGGDAASRPLRGGSALSLGGHRDSSGAIERRLPTNSAQDVFDMIAFGTALYDSPASDASTEDNGWRPTAPRVPGGMRRVASDLVVSALDVTISSEDNIGGPDSATESVQRDLSDEEMGATFVTKSDADQASNHAPDFVDDPQVLL